MTKLQWCHRKVTLLLSFNFQYYMEEIKSVYLKLLLYFKDFTVNNKLLHVKLL